MHGKHNSKGNIKRKGKSGHGSQRAESTRRVFDLADMLRDVVKAGATVKYCKTCIDRCGIHTGDMLDEIKEETMKIHCDWIMESDKVVTF